MHWPKNAFLMNPFQCPQWGRGVKHFDWAEQQNAVILRLSLEFIDLIDKQSDDFHLIISNPDRVFPQGIGQISIVWLQPMKKLICKIFLDLNCLPSEAGAIEVRVRSTDNEYHSLHPHCSCLKTILCNKKSSTATMLL